MSSLVSARVDTQLEFLAVGSWWIALPRQESNDTSEKQQPASFKLVRVPNGREDLLDDQSIDHKSRRALIKFLRFIGNFETQRDIWRPFESQPISNFLKSQFNLSLDSQQPIHAISMSSMSQQDTTTGFALPRIAKHLRSIGMFGQGFGAVLPKWGGLAEVAQVGCRAGAVGGGVYVLGNGVTSVGSTSCEGACGKEKAKLALEIELSNGEKLISDWLVCGYDNTPQSLPSSQKSKDTIRGEVTCRSISVIDSPLPSLFQSLGESAPNPVGAVVVISGEFVNAEEEHSNPVHIIIHSSDTGECPTGQCKYFHILLNSASRPGSNDDPTIRIHLPTLSATSLLRNQSLTN